MRSVKTVTARPIRILRNTRPGSKGDTFAEIFDARTGERLHRGQMQYIDKVARERYNHQIA